MKKNHLIFINLFIGILFFGCTKYKQVNYHFSALSLNLLNNSAAEPDISTADSLPAKAFGIRLNLHPMTDSETSGSFSAEHYYNIINTNTISAIYISSSDSFDVSLPPGSCLNNKFIYYKGAYDSFDTIGSQSSIKPTNYYKKDYEQNYLPEYADILLIHSSSKYKAQRFKIKLTFQDNSQFIDSTSLIKLY